MPGKSNVLHRAVLIGLLTPLMLLALVVSAAPQDSELSADVESIARGRTTYRIYCRNCHGKYGKGDGSIADLLKVVPTDLTQLTAINGEFPADLVYQVIDGRQEVKGHGRREMPIWGVVFQEAKDSDPETQVRERILNLVSFIESIQVVDGDADMPSEDPPPPPGSLIISY